MPSDQLGKFEGVHSPIRQDETPLNGLNRVPETNEALPPISLLPLELLSKVFKLCKEWSNEPHKPRNRLAWTQTCRTWRNIALSSPHFWQDVDLCDIHLARASIIRSRGNPVSISCSFPKTNIQYCFDLKINTISLTTIDVVLFPDDMLELFQVLGCHLVYLRDLTLKIPSMTSGLSLHFELPSIQYLALEGVSVTWEQCRNLRRLSLCRLSWELAPSISQLHNILRNSPDLEYARLERFSPVDDRSAHEFGNAIPLLNLQQLVISEKPSVLITILSLVHVGLETRMKLQSTMITNPIVMFPKGLPYPPEIHPGFSCLRLDTYEASLGRSVAPTWLEDESSTILSIRSSYCRITASVMNNIHSLLKLGKIETLKLCPMVLADISSSLLKEFLGHMKELKTLLVAFNDLETLLQVLSTPVGSLMQMVCPQLRVLSFSNIGNTWLNFDITWIDSIFRCVSQRGRYGSPIQTLEFGHFLLGRTRVGDRFSGVVKNVNVVNM